VVEHSPHHPRVRGLSAATAAGEDGEQKLWYNTSSGSRMVKQSPQHLNFEGLRPGTGTSTGRKKMVSKSFGITVAVA